MADDKVKIDAPKGGKLDISVSVTSGADGAKASAPAVQGAGAQGAKSIQSLNAAERKAQGEKSSAKSPAAKATSTAQLAAIVKTLEDIKVAIVSISASRQRRVVRQRAGEAGRLTGGHLRCADTVLRGQQL